MTQPTPVTEDGEVIGLPPNPPASEPVEDPIPDVPPPPTKVPPPMLTVDEDE